MKNVCTAIALMLTMLAACKDKETSIYAGACGVEPTADAVLVKGDTFDHDGVLVDSVYRAYVFIPNIFVPDPTPITYINDLFLIFGSVGVARIQSAVYTGADGEVLFSETSFIPNDSGHSWNGAKPDGSVYYGIFNYTVQVEFIDHQIKTYTGKACAYKCGDPGFPTERLPDCFFPAGNNGNGRPDHSIISHD